MDIRTYQQQHVAWDQFLAQSRNGAFFFKRGYMDYHADRFQDASLWIEKEGQVLAMLPASRDGDTIVSHGGLSFGGLVMSARLGAADVKALFEQLRDYWAAMGIKKLIYKPIPHIYHSMPSEEDLYALFRLGARTMRVDVSTTIMQESRLRLSKGRKHALSKATKAGVTIRKSDDYASCWQILTDNLQARHGTSPTHSLQEISLLASRCPEISLYMAYLHEQPIAGVVMFDFGRVAHTQYIAPSPVAREVGAVDLLLETLISEVYADKPYFNFGISTCHNGLSFNEGLCAQKEMFGGRTTTLQWLEMDCV